MTTATKTLTSHDAVKLAEQGTPLRAQYEDLPFGAKVVACYHGSTPAIGTLYPANTQQRQQYREPVVVVELPNHQRWVFRLEKLLRLNGRSVFAQL